MFVPILTEATSSLLLSTCTSADTVQGLHSKGLPLAAPRFTSTMTGSLVSTGFLSQKAPSWQQAAGSHAIARSYRAENGHNLFGRRALSRLLRAHSTQSIQH